MSNAVFLKNNVVELTLEEFNIRMYSELRRHHEECKCSDLEVDDVFCWFLRDNSEYKDGKLIIRFGEGNSSHTWRDFAQTINFLKTFMKKEKKHLFKIADEDSRCSFFDQEIILGREYNRYLNVINRE